MLSKLNKRQNNCISISASKKPKNSIQQTLFQSQLVKTPQPSSVWKDSFAFGKEYKKNVVQELMKVKTVTVEKEMDDGTKKNISYFHCYCPCPSNLCKNKGKPITVMKNRDTVILSLIW